MGSRTSDKLDVEVVLIGYDDFRLEKPTPFGFAVRAGDGVSVHQRADIETLQLPAMFSFTAKHMGAAIYKSASQTHEKTDLYDFVSRHHFSGVGSFRCWPAFKETVHPIQLDEIISSARRVVDDAVAEAQSAVEDYTQSVDISRWTRMPCEVIEMQKEPSVREQIFN